MTMPHLVDEGKVERKSRKSRDKRRQNKQFSNYTLVIRESSCVRLCVCECVCVNKYMYVYIHVYTCIHTYICLCAFACVSSYLCPYIYRRVCQFMNEVACMLLFINFTCWGREKSNSWLLVTTLKNCIHLLSQFNQLYVISNSVVMPLFCSK